MLRESVSSLLERRGYEVVGHAGDGPRLVWLVRELRPDVAVIDVRMPPTHKTEGLDAARTIRGEHPDAAILILSAHEVEHATTLLGSGSRTGDIGRRLWIAEGTVEKHVHSILTKLSLPETDDNHRRVLAVITFLDVHRTD